MATVDVACLDALVSDGWLKKAHHPEFPLVIWNYTPKTQYERHWTPETMMCRGLITTEEGEIIARPFPKFFNWNDPNVKLPDEPFEVFEKLDGSLGISYFWEGRWHLATRGSFTSEQAAHGTELLRRGSGYLVPGFTYLFEIIYPKNRIVVDYTDFDGLVFLGCTDTETGAAYGPNLLDWLPFPQPRKIDPAIYECEHSPGELAKLDWPNQEGFVVCFADGTRVKVKFPWYIEQHRFLSNMSNHDIWKHMQLTGGYGPPRTGDADLDKWARQWVVTIRNNWEVVANSVVQKLYEMIQLPSRKEQALALKGYPYRGAVFAALDKKHEVVSRMQWEWVKPRERVYFSRVGGQDG